MIRVEVGFLGALKWEEKRLECLICNSQILPFLFQRLGKGAWAAEAFIP